MITIILKALFFYKKMKKNIFMMKYMKNYPSVASIKSLKDILLKKNLSFRMKRLESIFLKSLVNQNHLWNNHTLEIMPIIYRKNNIYITLISKNIPVEILKKDVFSLDLYQRISKWVKIKVAFYEIFK